MECLLRSDLRQLQVSEETGAGRGFCVEALGDDPQILLPRIDIHPVGARFLLDTTLPTESMVQLFYQSPGSHEFSEAESMSASLPAGRSTFEFVLDTPLNGRFRLDPGNARGCYHIHAITILQACEIHPLISPEASPGEIQSHQVRDVRMTSSGLKFNAVGRDPYFVFPLVQMKPEAATVRLDISLQRGAMVQLYYQTVPQAIFSEELSRSESLTAGRHVLEWVIDRPLNGAFRLDPGNMPWEYCIHKMEILQSYHRVEVSMERLFEAATHTHQIDHIHAAHDRFTFQATGVDPYLVLPRVKLLPKPLKVVLDITVPEAVLVQLFYKTDSTVEFEEALSCRSHCAAGRHMVEFQIDGPVDGSFRLDPGTLPGAYTIHTWEFLQ